MLGRLLDLVFPPACLSCGAPGARFLCARCEQRFPRVGAGCDRCGRPLPRAAPACGDCRDAAFGRARAAAVYEGPARDVLMAFKLGGERRAGREMAARMARTADGLRPGVVTYVPATRRAVAERGFNPAEVLARHVARALRLPLRPMLAKVRETADQAGLGRAERRANLRGAFRALRSVPALPTLLVDDVMTTGATASLCARALLDRGTPEVIVLTFARAG